MRKTFNIGFQLFFLPFYLSINSRKIHFFHDFVLTFFMKQSYILFTFCKNQKSTCEFIESMKHMQILISVLEPQYILQSIVVITSACMNSQTRRFVDYQKLLIIMNFVDWQVQYWRLNSCSCMNNSIAVFNDISRIDFAFVYQNIAILNSFSVVLRWIGFELFDQNSQKLLSQPSTFSESFVNMSIWLHKSKGKYFDINWFVFLFLFLVVVIFLRLFKIISIIDFHLYQRFVQSSTLYRLILFMRQSFLPEKNNLKHSVSGKKVVDYTEYKKRLDQFQKQNSNIAGLFDWSIPSHIVSLSHPSTLQRRSSNHARQLQMQRNQSLNTDELLQSQRPQSSLSSNIQVHQQYKSSPKLTKSPQYKNKTTVQLQKQLKQMREEILSFNTQLNARLNRYELAKSQRKKIVQQTPYQNFIKQIEKNKHLELYQSSQVNKLIEMDHQLQGKDYLIELIQMISLTNQQIRQMIRTKHERWVDVQKFDKMLKEIDQIEGSQDQFRQIKQLRKNLIFYFKKLQENNKIQDQLDTQLHQLQDKNIKTDKNLASLSAKARLQKLEVSTNRGLIEMKKRYSDIFGMRQGAVKKKDTLIRSIKMNCDVLQKQCNLIKRQVQKIEMQIQQMEYQNQVVQQDNQTYIGDQKIANQKLKSISYKFDMRLISNNSLKKAERHSFNDISKIDKNIVDQNTQKEHSVLSSIKPVVRKWRGQTQRPRYNNISEEKYHTLDSSNIYKPRPLIRVKK